MNESSPATPPVAALPALDPARFPEAVADAAALGHRFFLLSLTREDVDDRGRYAEIRELMLSTGTLIASQPPLETAADLVTFHGQAVHLLVATVLDRELLDSLLPLEPTQVQEVPVPENLAAGSARKREEPGRKAALAPFPAQPRGGSEPVAFPALIVRIGSLLCALPPAGLREAVVRPPESGPPEETGEPGGRPTPWPRFHHRGESLPLIDLTSLLDTVDDPPPPGAAPTGPVLLIEALGNRFGLPVQEVVGRQMVTAHPIPAPFRGAAPFAATALTADGAAALLVDYPALLQAAGVPPGDLEPWTRPAHDPEPDDTAADLTLVTFTVGERRFGIDARLVGEVDRSPALAPTPGTPEIVHGLVNRRGQVVLLCDLGRRLAIGRAQAPEPCHIIIKSRKQARRSGPAPAAGTWLPERPVGLTVDRLDRVVRISRAAIQPVGDADGDPAPGLVQGVAVDPSGPLVILDVGAVLEPLRT